MSHTVRVVHQFHREAADRGFSPMRLLRTWLAERRRIGGVEAELHLHTDRELADLGLSRADIPAVARGRYQRG